jgi:hypothetical protein
MSRRSWRLCYQHLGTYEAQDGGRRTVPEIEFYEVGISLRNATAKVAEATAPLPATAAAGRARRCAWRAGS